MTGGDGGSQFRSLLLAARLTNPVPSVTVPADGRAHGCEFESVDYLGTRTTVFAYLARPTGSDSRRPAIALVHGGEGRAFAEWAELWAGRGYVAIAMDLGGHRADGSRDSESGPDHDDTTKFTSLRDGVENSWVFHAVAAVLRSIDILESLAEVDQGQVFITGISWGAHVAEIAAALCPRIAAACFVYGCGYIDENPVLGEHLGDLSSSQQVTWIREFDPRFYIPDIAIPTLWISGATDEFYPIGLFERSLELAPGAPVVRITPDMRHGHEEGWAPAEIEMFFEGLRGRGGGLVHIAPIAVEARSARSAVAGAITSASLWTTRDSGDWMNRLWQSSPAAFADGLLSAEIPPKSSAGFFVAAGSDETVTSSRLRSF